MNCQKIFSAGGHLDCFGLCYKKGFREEDRGQYDKEEEIFFAQSPTMAVRSRALREVWVFDLLFFYHEDVDLSWRMWLRGYKIVLVPKSVVYHKGGLGVTKLDAHISGASLFHSCKNRITLALKNFELLNCIKYSALYITLIAGLGLYYLVKAERGHIGLMACIRAILWNLRSMESIWTKRVKVQRLIRRVPDSRIISRFTRSPIRIKI